MLNAEGLTLQRTFYNYTPFRGWGKKKLRLNGALIFYMCLQNSELRTQN
jgi:hypothetical protein